MSNWPARLKTCCEPGCDKPVAPNSRVRCVDHYRPPTYGTKPAERTPRSDHEGKDTP